ncbi:MAG: putative selenium-dependent hydroxylase accessory protein YqeC [Ruminococcaceae bacterium]|jgi:probable selenium-dependent hydroxylase accessory protein YqeC|nr:putative selenium-dependent hydroxylase accessory protein YqeC [Oscillospiraceae bacterium]
MEIAPLLQVGRGVTALIGGGGKTTLLYTLAEELRSRGTVLLCTSTRICRPEQYPVLTDAGAEAVRSALERYGAVCAGISRENGKLGAPELSFSALAQLADYVIVEADGAHMLPLKAHAPWEPVIPENAEQTILVVGAGGFGHPIGEVCHRPELYAALAGARAEDAVTPELAARVITAEGLGDRVYINQVERPDNESAALELARYLTCPVAAGSLCERRYTCLR